MPDAKKHKTLEWVFNGLAALYVITLPFQIPLGLPYPWQRAQPAELVFPPLMALGLARLWKEKKRLQAPFLGLPLLLLHLAYLGSLWANGFSATGLMDWLGFAYLSGFFCFIATLYSPDLERQCAQAFRFTLSWISLSVLVGLASRLV